MDGLDEIQGPALRAARKRLGFNSIKEAAHAYGVSERTFGEWERSGVSKHEVARVRAMFWPEERPQTAVVLAQFDDMELLSEIGRRFALYKRERDMALEQSTDGVETNPGSGPKVAGGSGFGGVSTGVRPRLHGELSLDEE